MPRILKYGVEFHVYDEDDIRELKDVMKDVFRRFVVEVHGVAIKWERKPFQSLSETTKTEVN